MGEAPASHQWGAPGEQHFLRVILSIGLPAMVQQGPEWTKVELNEHA